MNSGTFLYFTYGLNMLARRLKMRTPSVVSVKTGYVNGRRLTFDKQSSDGSGKCGAETTGNITDRVYGVIFKIAVAEKPALDEAEGLGKGYEKEIIEVVITSDSVKAMTYIATKKEPILRPYNWYKAITIAGAVKHGLRSDFVGRLRTFESNEYPNTDRRARNEALLFS